MLSGSLQEKFYEAVSKGGEKKAETSGYQL